MWGLGGSWSNQRQVKTKAWCYFSSVVSKLLNVWVKCLVERKNKGSKKCVHLECLHLQPGHTMKLNIFECLSVWDCAKMCLLGGVAHFFFLLKGVGVVIHISFRSSLATFIATKN